MAIFYLSIQWNDENTTVKGRLQEVEKIASTAHFIE